MRRIVPFSLFALLIPLPFASAQQVLFEFTGDADDVELGLQVAGGGDANADGWPDLLIAAKDGRVWLRSGQDGTILRQFGSAGSLIRFGWGLSFAGDVDGDGHDDVLIGAPFDNGVAMRTGSVEMFSGRTGARLFKWWGENFGQNFGQAVVGGADFDGDGVPDVAVGAPLERFLNQPGFVKVFSGLTGSEIAHLDGIDPVDFFGWTLAALDDIDLDGRPELIVGAPTAHMLFGAKGEIRVYSGRNFSMIRNHLGERNLDSLGTCVGGAGDWNGDGHADYMAGAVGVSEGRIYSGRNGRVLHRFTEHADDRLGGECAFAGDIDHDGFRDLVFGGRAGATGLGAVWVYSGNGGQTLQRFDGQNDGDLLGDALASVGDMNQDGYADFVMSAPTADVGFQDNGVVQVISGFVPFRHVMPSPGTSGVSNTFAVIEASVGDRVAFLYGQTPGQATSSRCASQWVDLSQPQLIGIGRVQPNTTATISARVPASAAGRTILFQALSLGTCKVSSRIAHTFQ